MVNILKFRGGGVLLIAHNIDMKIKQITLNEVTMIKYQIGIGNDISFINTLQYPYDLYGGQKSMTFNYNHKTNNRWTVRYVLCVTETNRAREYVINLYP